MRFGKKPNVIIGKRLVSFACVCFNLKKVYLHFIVNRWKLLSTPMLTGEIPLSYINLKCFVMTYEIFERIIPTSKVIVIVWNMWKPHWNKILEIFRSYHSGSRTIFKFQYE